jgi:protein SCO1/2
MNSIRKISSASAFVALAIFIPLAAFMIENWWEKKYMAVPVIGGLFKEEVPQTISYHFQNQRGENTGPQSWNKKVMVVDFFFTSCPSICPAMTNNLKKVQQQFGKDIRIISFTVDPEHDNPEKLRQYAKRFKVQEDNWQFMTGNKKDIYHLARKEFRITAIDGDGGSNDFIHSNQLVLVDAQQRVRGYYDGTSEKEVNNLVRDIHKLLNE